MVEIWSKPNCIQCDATKMTLEARGIEFEEFSLVEDAEALARFKSAGYMSAPIVISGDQTWSGFRPDLIEKI